MDRDPSAELLYPKPMSKIGLKPTTINNAKQIYTEKTFPVRMSGRTPRTWATPTTCTDGNTREKKAFVLENSRTKAWLA